MGVGDGSVRASGAARCRVSAGDDDDEVDMSVPVFRQVVLDCTDARALAEFYRQLLDLAYRPGDEPPAGGADDPRGQDWLVLRSVDGHPQLAFQQVCELAEPSWPEGPHPQMLHLDLTVPDVVALDEVHERVQYLGAWMLYDRSDDVQEPLRVYADPAGHPFCVVVAPSP